MRKGTREFKCTGPSPLAALMKSSWGGPLIYRERPGVYVFWWVGWPPCAGGFDLLDITTKLAAPLVAGIRPAPFAERAEPRLSTGRSMEFGAGRGHTWQRRFYDFVVFTEYKRAGKLRYMHQNPVKHGLV